MHTWCILYNNHHHNNTLVSPCRAMCSFVQELFAAKVFVPAMNVAAKPVSPVYIHITLCSPFCRYNTMVTCPLLLTQDFINKLLLVTFDPNSVSVCLSIRICYKCSFFVIYICMSIPLSFSLSLSHTHTQRLERMHGPPSKDVSFLFRFAKERKGVVKSPLQIPVPELISANHHLYTFMMFMKSQNNIHLLQVYLNLGECGQ